MFHHDITLTGRESDVRALRMALVAAGAEHLDEHDQVRLQWRADPGPAPVEALAAEHPAVDVGTRRLDRERGTVQERTIVGGQVRVDRERRVFRSDDGEVSCRWGLCFDEDGERLDPALLRRVADDILTIEEDQRSAVRPATLPEALLLADEAGRLARAVGEMSDQATPSSRALAALRHLASAALTIACVPDDQSGTAVRASRAYRMQEVLVHAGHEELWDTPGHADWTAWVGYILSAVGHAIDTCITSAHATVWVSPDGHDDSGCGHPDRRREAATGALVSTCVQALALFAGDGTTACDL